jgi:hypothetical protein
MTGGGGDDDTDDDDGAVRSTDLLAPLFRDDASRPARGEDGKRVSVRAGGGGRHRARLEARRSETAAAAAAATTTTRRRVGFVGDADRTSAIACAERYVPKWCKGGGGGGGGGKDGEEEPSTSVEDGGGSKKVKKNDAAMSVVTTHDLGRGRRCVVQATSDCEPGGDPVRSRWDVEADVERRFATADGLDEDYKAFHATVNAHTLTKEVELELGSVHQEFGMEFRQSVKGRLDRGLVTATRATSASFSFGTPTKQYDAFRLLHGVNSSEEGKPKGTEPSEAKTERKTEKRAATPRTNAAKAQYAYNFEKASARAVVTANSKPPSPNPESSHPLRDAIDVKFRATSDIVKSHAVRLAVRAKLNSTTRAQIIAKSKLDKAGQTRGLELELGRDFKTSSRENAAKMKTTVSFSIPLTKYALKLTGDGAASSYSLRLSSHEVVAETRLRRGRRVELRLGARKSFLVASSSAIETFIAIGFSQSFHPQRAQSDGMTVATVV